MSGNVWKLIFRKKIVSRANAKPLDQRGRIERYALVPIRSGPEDIPQSI